MTSSARSACLLLIVLGGFAPTASGQVHPAYRPGLQTGSTFQGGQVDNVNLYNGNLTIQIPISQQYPVGGLLSYGLALTYNSAAWRFGSDSDDDQPIPVAGTIPSASELGVWSYLRGNETHNAGFGWRLSVAQLWAADDPNSPFNGDGEDKFLLIEPDGTHRFFYETLHEGETFDCSLGFTTVNLDQQYTWCREGWYYTRDGSYLRAWIKRLGDGEAGENGLINGPKSLDVARVESPNGIVRYFDTLGRLDRIEDQYGNAAIFNLPYPLPGGVTPPDNVLNTWTITDSEGNRTHTLHWEPDTRTGATDAARTGWRLDYVELETFGGATTTVDLVHNQTTVDHIGGYEDIEVALLEKIEIGVGSSGVVNNPELTYTMGYYDNSTFHLPFDFPEVVTEGGSYAGGLQALTLPTGGRYEWTYTDWEITNCFAGEIYRNAAGVRRKKIFELGGSTPSGTWQYIKEGLPLTAEGFTFDYQAPPLSRRTLVRDPEGNDILHYFASEEPPTTDPPTSCELSQWYNGLPFARSTDDFDGTVAGGQLYLSSVAYEGPANPADLRAGRVRRNYVRYTADQGADQNGGNQRLVRSRTYYDDDASRWKETAYSDFDGLGNYRTVVQSGSSAWGTTANTQRTSATNFNLGGGSYNYDILSSTGPSGNFTLPSTAYSGTGISWPTNIAWVTGVHDQRSTLLNGSQTVSEHCFDHATGSLLRTRRLRESTRSEVDVVTKYDYDSNGNVQFERTYGGDANFLLPDDAPYDLCSQSLPSPEYQLQHRYTSGALDETRYNNGTDLNWPVLKLEIDESTGLPVESSDSSELEIDSMSYDLLGRLTEYQPSATSSTASETATDVTYTAANGTTAFTKTTSRGTAGGAVQEELDGFGRIALEIRDVVRASGPAKMHRRTCYNSMGWLLSRSEWLQGDGDGANGTTCPTTTTPRGWTIFQEHDRFGRPTIILPPDVRTHRVQLTYKGERLVERKMRVATDTVDPTLTCASKEDDENCVEYTYTYDLHGRLEDVNAPPGGADATYRYDELDRLTKVTVTDGTTNQVREFRHDGRGFTTAQKHPEKGINGNGWTRTLFDSRGNVTEVFESDGDTSSNALQFHLGFDYDEAERIETVTDEIAGQVVKSFTYYTVNTGTNPITGSGSGKGKLATATRHNRIDLGDGNGEFDLAVTESYQYLETGGRISSLTTSTSTSPSAGFSNTWRQEWDYNSLGQMTSERYPCRWSGAACVDVPPTIDRTYSKNYLTAITGWVDDIHYHSNGTLAEIDWADLGQVDEYLQDMDPDSIQRPGSIGSTLLAYDGAGNVKGTLFDSDGPGVGEDPQPEETFRYDQNSRLRSFGLGDGNSQTYTYDAFSNLLTTTSNPTELATDVAPNIDASTNRISNANWTYDAAGNVTSTNGFSFDWDPMGMMRRFNEANRTFVYTPSEERIGILDGFSETWTLRDLSGMLIREYLPLGAAGDTIFADDFEPQLPSTPGDTRCWSQEEPPGPGPYSACPGEITRNSVHGLGYLLAVQIEEDDSTKRYFSVPNWLGTPRQWILDTNMPGQPRVNNVLLGYGIQAYNQGSNTSLSRHLFTAHERDFNTSDGIPEDDDFDMMHARMYWPMYGRFLSPDPVGGSPAMPGSWNRYAYVLDNPASMVDPDGRLGVPISPCMFGICQNILNVNDDFEPIQHLHGRLLASRFSARPRLWGRSYSLDALEAALVAIDKFSSTSEEELRERETLRCSINRLGLENYGFPYGSDSISLDAPWKEHFYKAKQSENQFHGAKQGNLKYLSKSGLSDSGSGYGSFEVILSPNEDGTWRHVLDPELIGTFNFGNTALSHLVLDIYPWWKVGSAACP